MLHTCLPGAIHCTDDTANLLRGEFQLQARGAMEIKGKGEIIQMSPIGLRHSLCVAALINRLTRAIGDRAHIWASNPVRLFRDTEPQPDVVFIRGPLSRYSQHPGPSDVLFLVEVSDTSYR